MNAIDVYVAQFFSTLCAHHPLIDSFLFELTSSYFLKGQIVMVMFWWAWFSPGPQRLSRRRILVSTIVACVLALAVGRIMVSSLPPRARPIDNPVFRFQPPVPMDETPDSSSFPSDHAILFFALATGILFTSRRLGALALTWVAVIVCLPRLWLGYHYPSDILAGGLIGSGFMLALNWHKLRAKIADPVLALCMARPQLVYAGLFLFSYQVAEMFNPVRRALHLLHHPATTAMISILNR
jgi:undecaprenyl-diphosphatase